MKMEKLYELVVGSPELKERLAEICAEKEAEGPEAVAAAVLAFVEELGFHMTAEEARAFFEELQKGGVLNEVELDMVVGSADLGPTRLGAKLKR